MSPDPCCRADAARHTPRNAHTRHCATAGWLFEGEPVWSLQVAAAAAQAGGTGDACCGWLVASATTPRLNSFPRITCPTAVKRTPPQKPSAQQEHAFLQHKQSRDTQTSSCSASAAPKTTPPLPPSSRPPKASRSPTADGCPARIHPSTAWTPPPRSSSSPQ